MGCLCGQASENFSQHKLQHHPLEPMLTADQPHGLRLNVG
jgi:hypothetical protein